MRDTMTAVRSAPPLFLGTAAKVTGGESGSRTKSQGIGSV